MTHRVTGQRGDVSRDSTGGDVGCDVTGGKRFCGAPLMGKGGLGGGGSATAQRLTRGGSTAGKPPISRTLTIGGFGDEKARPPLIWGAGDRTAGEMDEAVEG